MTREQRLILLTKIENWLDRFREAEGETSLVSDAMPLMQQVQNMLREELFDGPAPWLER